MTKLSQDLNSIGVRVPSLDTLHPDYILIRRYIYICLLRTSLTQLYDKVELNLECTLLARGLGSASVDQHYAGKEGGRLLERSSLSTLLRAGGHHSSSEEVRA